MYFCHRWNLDQEMHELYRQKTDLDKVIIDHAEAYSLYGHVMEDSQLCLNITKIILKIYIKWYCMIVIGKDHYHLFVPSDRAHHIEKFEVY